MAKRLAPVHPGEILLEGFLRPLGLSQYRLAKGLGRNPPECRASGQAQVYRAGRCREGEST